MEKQIAEYKDVYAYGLPFSNILGENINDLIKRIANKKASLIIIDGQMGEGKTTLALLIAQYIELVYKGENPKVSFYQNFLFDFEKQLSLGGVDFQEKLQLCNDSNLHVLIYDEAGDFGKRGAITEFNKTLNRIFQTFRAYKILVICCLPNFNVLDGDLFMIGVPRMLLNCYERDNCDGSFRAYDLDSMFYLKKYMKDNANPLKSYQSVTPNFRGHFKDLPYDISRKLEEISLKGKKEILSNNIIKSQGLMSIRDIASRLNRGHQWVRLTIKKLKLRPMKIYKKVKYFDDNALINIEAEIKN
jgi:hypothetical protein